MSDVEEPPTKMSKYEEYLDPEGEECLEEGQEEWLSEGVLTDDDYVQTAEQDQEHDKTDVTLPPNMEDNDTNQTLEETDTIQTTTVIGQVELHDGSITHASITHGTIVHSGVSHGAITHGGVTHAGVPQGNITQNIEEQLNNLESHNGDELPDDLDAFLIRKADGQVVEAKVKDDAEPSKINQQEDDGNDTDDLLRMLGEDDQKSKKKTFKVVKADKMDDQGSSDDDDFIYERSQVKTLKLAKNALIKRTATKAVPEDMSDGDDETEPSSDEGTTMQRMFEVKKPTSASKKSEPKRIVRHVVQVNSGSNRNQKPEQKFNSKQSFVSQKQTSKTLPKLAPKPNILQKSTKSVEIKTPTPFKPLDKSTSKDRSTSKERMTSKDRSTSKDRPTSKLSKSSESKIVTKNEEFDEIIDEEEFLEEEVSDLDEEEFGEESEGEGSKKQRIMRPEMMDEEVPSDAESRSEDGSLYDELPSSDSEDLDDWFTLDIRAERAGDYLPLLGTKARELLLAERRRVSSKVATLRQSLSALTDSARRQADQLRAAAMALAEIDDTLRAA
ncbi:hypothetical protein PYW08_012780 [Mythimna loreyi]|uniref:Uncharacterized protein n=1 Tax=Mythimna loreyi TaxID=667449 RepID=A0ACC2Q167_9NEOP|nr:hypothetical protein PYW08_012780 [Mythimna loreyi]